MFEIGQKYEFRMIEGGAETMFWGTIETYEHPLVKIADSEPLTINYGGETKTEIPSYPGQIINVTSPNFISAVKKPE